MEKALLTTALLQFLVSLFILAKDYFLFVFQVV